MKVLSQILLLSAITSALPADASAADWLSAQQWQRRLVLAVEVDEAALRSQTGPLNPALIDRRLSVWRLDGDVPVWVAGAAPVAGSEAAAADAAAIRDRLGIERPGLHLVGLDGGVKAHRSRIEQLDELMDALDSMPMRVREMRRRDDVR
jgi:hypothetical protein